mmetsp:Transcript_15570/g.26545  ORF Transcript_15570/g.26545 Transcript_15570/m.26545 type:complete len:95 (+) Transcript_15570:122-406(+)
MVKRYSHFNLPREPAEEGRRRLSLLLLQPHQRRIVKHEDPLERYLVRLLLAGDASIDAQIKLRREEYALSMMGQRSNYARAKDAQMLFRMEECA